MSENSQRILPADFDQCFQQAFGLVAFAANRHILDHMRRITVELGMDLEMALIWGTLAHLNVMSALPPDSDLMAVLDDNGLAKFGKLEPVRLSDLAQVTGLARETVRRKLERLHALGKVERTDSGKWLFTNTGIDQASRDFTRETVIRLLRTAEAVIQALDQARTVS